MQYTQNVIKAIAVMEAARTSETSDDIQLRTHQYIPEDSRRRENLKSLSLSGCVLRY
jgi:hypothetical protein